MVNNKFEHKLKGVIRKCKRAFSQGFSGKVALYTFEKYII